jgi:acyl-CoA synthetase (NDP forming)
MSMTERKLYSARQLQRLLAPQSVAIVGASATAGSIGNLVLRGQSAFKGRIYPVNARYDEIEGFKAYPSLSALPEAPDCVVVASSRSTVLSIVEESGKVRAGGVVVLASGFAELQDPELADLQARIAQTAHAQGLPLLGPNCIGYANIAAGAYMTFVPVIPVPEITERAIGVVTQSGALGFALAQAAARGVSFSHIFACGNASDVEAADLINYLVEAPECRAILVAIEGLSQPARMIQAARAAKLAGKPLILHAMGNSVEGALAARSHTGSVAGGLDALRVALRAERAIVVDDYDQLVEVAVFLAKAPPQATAAGVAVLATSGGAAIMAADTADRFKVPLPELGPSVLAALRRQIPDFVTIRNPCDVTAQNGNNPEGFNDCARALLEWDQCGALIVPQTYSWRGTEERIAGLARVAAGAKKPVCVVWMSEDLGGASVAKTERSDLIMFRSMERCFAALAPWLNGSG